MSLYIYNTSTFVHMLKYTQDTVIRKCFTWKDGIIQLALECFP